MKHLAYIALGAVLVGAFIATVALFRSMGAEIGYAVLTVTGLATVLWCLHFVGLSAVTAFRAVSHHRDQGRIRAINEGIGR